MIILVRYGEIHLKGKNRGFFERTLIKNIGGKVEKIGGRLIVRNGDAEKIAKVFGVHSVSVADEIENSQIEKYCEKLQIPNGTFKVVVNRANKNYPLTSMELAKKLGEIILTKNPELKVDVHNPDFVLNVDVRERTYVFTKTIQGVGGMPVGTAGTGLLLLSGGIDSPVAGFLAAKRGLALSAIHFTTPPYTSAAATEKVKTLAQSIGIEKLYVVPLTEQMQQIKKLCNPAYTITLMRRLMVKIANKFEYQCLVTGENLAQVASQTIEGITTNDICSQVPILRPLICYDKYEIVDLAKKIGTYETSIINHQDCCSVFVPDSPATKPTVQKCEEEEQKLNVEAMIEKAVKETEIVRLS